MSTAEDLERLTDPAKFESAAMAVLRLSDPVFRFIVPHGINAQGKTVVSPLDGIVQVPHETPPRFAMAEMTTQATLSSKWLAQSERDLELTDADAGDLVKAAREARRKRAAHPTARFTVALVTNRQPSAELQDDVEKYAAKHGLDLALVTRGMIAQFLDHTADGAYLREQLFGTLQTRLSRDLLHEIGLRSADLYSATYGLNRTHQWVEEPYETELEQATTGSNRVSLLVADSGRGKSSAALRLIDRTLHAGRLAMWCAPDDFADSVSLEVALLRALKRVRPELDTYAGATALQIVTAVDQLH